MEIKLFDTISMPIESKKDAVKLGETNAKQIIEAGEQDLFKLSSQSFRLEEFLKAFNKQLRNGVQDELNGGKFEAYGMEFTEKNGSSRLNYKDDEVWLELNAKLKEREELLKVAEKSKEQIFDNEGVEVPRVSRSGGGEILNVKY